MAVLTGQAQQYILSDDAAAPAEHGPYRVQGQGGRIIFFTAMRQQYLHQPFRGDTGQKFRRIAVGRWPHRLKMRFCKA